MALKGVKSIHDTINCITKDIDNYLIKEEHFGIPNKSTIPQFAVIKGEPKYFKDLGGDSQVIYRCFVTGRELVVESIYTDNGAGSEVFNEGFTDEDTFVQVYNLFTEWLRKTLK